MQWTEKEKSLLKDLKGAEELCAEKYTKYSETAKDPNLKNLFSQIASKEREHLNTITQMESGTVPAPAAGGGSTSPAFTAVYQAGNNPDKQNDAYLCTDLLADEKYTSHLYDTCIFEFAEENARNILNHIQKEEQEHGKMLYDYMKTNSMYS